MKRFKRFTCVAAASLLLAAALPLSACSKNENEFILRVASWEEYIDLGDWDDDELIEIYNEFAEDGGDGVIGVNSMVDDFTEWFNSGDFGFTVKVEYSTFGTNEDLYNRLNLGDKYDLVCPSDYLIMKLLAEDRLVPYSSDFRDEEKEDNYYAQYVSPYIYDVFYENGWSDYAACYMWGTTGLVYNPEIVDAEDVSSWTILQNTAYSRRVTIKDNVRDSYFPALAIRNREELLSDDVTAERRSELLNATDQEAIDAAEKILKKIKDNVYSFETDSGKADMLTGKVAANYQWSGDSVYIMDEADEDDVELWYSVPDECTNLWFDGWVMLKDGIKGNEQRKEAAEAFVNFLSRPDNAIRNMYYIGYTSAIADDTVFEYMKWNYGAESDDTVKYDLSYFFGDSVEDPVLVADAENFEISDNGINRGRQLFAQYPPSNVIERSVVMLDFGDKLSEINQMWINVRCPDLKDVDPAVWGVVGGIAGVSVIAICLYVFRYRLFISYRPRKGYEKVEK